MIKMHGCFRLLAVLAIMHQPLTAMSPGDPVHKVLRENIYKILVSVNDRDAALYAEGIACIRNGQHYLKRLSFSAFKLFPAFERIFLKALVIHKEKGLLPDFLEMYRRSYPQSRDGINFTYKLEKQNGRKKEIIEYTLLDVALAAYAEVPEQKKAGAEAEIMQLLIAHGGQLKLYRGINLAQPPNAHRKKRCRKEDSKQEPQSEEPQPSIHLPVPTDVGPLLDIQETGDGDNIVLESGALVTFNFDDYK